MKANILLILSLFLFVSCGRDGLKEDITLPEPPPAEKKVDVIYPQSSQSYTSGNDENNIIYIAWKGLSYENPVRMDLYKDNDFINILQIRTGVDSSLCKISDSLTTSSHYRVKVYEENNPDFFGLSEEFTIKGIFDDSSSTGPVE